MTDTVTLFLAVLSVAAEATVVVAVAFAVVGGRRARTRMREVFGPDVLMLALVVATVSMVGSLWFSYGADFVPCTLCWYQRICMYPLVPLLAAGLILRDPRVRVYAGILAAIGLCLSAYHIVLERFPSLESDVCDRANPCTIIWVRRFGYLTIPTMAASAFALIIVCTLVARPTLVEDR
jgi:disulfide bond formation protein DsbB